jgi:hypothetical protein
VTRRTGRTGACGRRPAPGRPTCGGASLLEATLACALLGMLAASGVLAAARAVARSRAPATAERFQSEVRWWRAQAIATATSLGLEVREGEGDWMVSVYEDGDGDGIRRDDVRAGRDRLREGPRPWSARMGEARPGFHPALSELRSPPPEGRPLGALVDPVRFGRSAYISFSPRGSVSPGTLYVTDGRERQVAVVVYGATGRVRVWEYDLRAAAWRAR